MYCTWWHLSSNLGYHQGLELISSGCLSKWLKTTGKNSLTGSQKSRVKVLTGAFSIKDPEGEFMFCLFQLLSVPGILGLQPYHSRRRRCGHITPSRECLLCVSLIRALAIGYGAHPDNSGQSHLEILNLINLQRPFYQINSCSHIPGIRTWTYLSFRKY